MTETNLLDLWQALHPVTGALNWIMFLCTFPVLTMLFIRCRAKFLLVFLLGNAVLLLSSLPNELFPQGEARPPSVGVLIEIMRLLHYGIHIIGTGMCIHWFMKTRGTPNTAPGTYFRKLNTTP